MSRMLNPGQAVVGELTGVAWSVSAFLGAGGQGEVYVAETNRDRLALKWYYPESATQVQRDSLRALIGKGPPSDVFLWPLDLVSSTKLPGFGYLMPVRDSRFCSTNRLMRGRVEPRFSVLATAGFNLAGAFLDLHSRGLAYRDISFGNVFLDPQTGAVSICDNDNVSVDCGRPAAVSGTPKFMAPEIVRGEALPSTFTDQHSLAVLLFYLFFRNHPLEGKREEEIRCLDAPAMALLHGKQPIFIMDPSDKSNRPVPGLHDSCLAFWNLCPRYLRRLFTRAFTVGLRTPGQRVKESEWRQAMLQLRDCIYLCQQCRHENYVNLDIRAEAVKQRDDCWNCEAQLVRPFVLRSGSRIIALNPATRVFRHHVDAARLNDFTEAVGEVCPHPTLQDVWGLKNLCSVSWKAIDAQGRENEVASGRSIQLSDGLRIRFGTAEATVFKP